MSFTGLDEVAGGRYLKRAGVFSALLAALAIATCPSCVFTAAAQIPNPPKPRPAWLHDTPIILVSNHDSMPIFRRRAGGNPTWQEDDYEKEHTDEAIRKLKELGVTVVIVHFYKGFGLQAEREHMEKAKLLAANARFDSTCELIVAAAETQFPPKVKVMRAHRARNRQKM